jgi:FimV-like protein
MDMGDNSSAIGPLKDIAANGSPAQQSEAAELLKKIN